MFGNLGTEGSYCGSGGVGWSREGGPVGRPLPGGMSSGAMNRPGGAGFLGPKGPSKNCSSVNAARCFILLNSILLYLCCTSITHVPPAHELAVTPLSWPFSVPTWVYVCPVAQSCLTLLPCSLSMGFSRQEYWNGVQFPSPVGPHL